MRRRLGEAFRRRLPSREQILAHRFVRPVRHWLDDGRLWHLSRHTVPGALAIGVFAAMLPPPLQTASAVVLACRCRVHLPTALLGTLLSNPFTIVPIYWLAYELGALLLGRPWLSLAQVYDAASTDISGLWTLLGWPWLLGLVLLTAVSCLLAWQLTRVVWACSIRLRWQHRRRVRQLALHHEK